MGIREDLQSEYSWRPIAIWVGIAVINIAVSMLNPRNYITRRCKVWQLAITNRAAWAKEVKHPGTYWAFDVLDPAHLARSSFLPISGVLIFRLLVVGYFLFCMIWQAVGPLDVATRYKTSKPGDWMLYFTNWTFVGLALYAVLGVAVCLKEWQLSSSASDSDKEQVCRPLHCVFLVVYIAVYAAAITLTAFYWLVIYDGRAIHVDNPLRHGGNIALLTFELFMTRIPVTFYHFQVVILYGTTYTLFMWIYYFVSGDWTYSSLDWSKPSSVMYYPILPVLLFIAFLIMYGLATLRERLVARSCCRCYNSHSCSAFTAQEMGRIDQLPPAGMEMMPSAAINQMEEGHPGIHRLKSY